MGGRGRNNSKVVLPVQGSDNSALKGFPPRLGLLAVSADPQKSSILLSDLSSRFVSHVDVLQRYWTVLVCRLEQLRTRLIVMNYQQIFGDPPFIW